MSNKAPTFIHTKLSEMGAFHILTGDSSGWTPKSGDFYIIRGSDSYKQLHYILKTNKESFVTIMCSDHPWSENTSNIIGFANKKYGVDRLHVPAHMFQISKYFE